MSLHDLLARLSGALNQAGVPYMIAGSIASNYYSAPRTTQDVDLVVELDGARLQALLASLPEDELYYSMDAARDALLRRGASTSRPGGDAGPQSLVGHGGGLRDLQAGVGS